MQNHFEELQNHPDSKLNVPELQVKPQLNFEPMKTFVVKKDNDNRSESSVSLGGNSADDISKDKVKARIQEEQAIDT